MSLSFEELRDLIRYDIDFVPGCVFNIHLDDDKCNPVLVLARWPRDDWFDNLLIVCDDGVVLRRARAAAR